MTTIKFLHKNVFYALLFLLPVNLGKHYEFLWSYVNGRLVDYLVPTVYVTEILICLILVLWFLEIIIKKDLRMFIPLVNERGFQFLILFLFSFLLSVLQAENFEAALFSFAKLFLYFLLFLYIVFNFSVKTDFVRMAKIFSVSLFLLAVLAFVQWEKQSSAFDNYLFFGEQPYSYSTYDVVKENYFGQTRIPPYGTFRHPNVFAGFLLLGLTVITVLLPHWFVLIVLTLGALALFYTFSYSAWSVGVVSIAFLLLARLFRKNVKQAFTLATFGAIFLLSLLPVYSLPSSVAEHPSVYRRIDLIRQSVDLLKDTFMFGTGLNNFYYYSSDFMFNQPVHSLYLLTLVEGGVFTFLFFVLFLGVSIKKASKYPLLLLLLLQILLLSSFDHYFYTIHQTQLFFWVILGVLYAYTIRSPYTETRSLNN